MNNNKHGHRCAVDGKKRQIETTYCRDAEWHKGYCAVCESNRYFEKDGEEVTPA